MFISDNAHCQVIATNKGQIMRCRIVKFKTYKLKFYPGLLYNQALLQHEQIKPRVNLLHSVPVRDSETAPRTHTAQKVDKEAISAWLTPPASEKLTMHTLKLPSTISDAQISTEADEWQKCFETEEAMHAPFGTFEYVDEKSVPVATTVLQAVVNFTNEYD